MEGEECMSVCLSGKRILDGDMSKKSPRIRDVKQGPNSTEKKPTEKPTENLTENPTEIPYTKKKSKNG